MRMERIARETDDYEKLMESGEMDAVYIALPNHLHREFAVVAARHGVHMLCESPMAVTSQDCRAIEGLERSMAGSDWVRFDELPIRERRPDLTMERHLPPVHEEDLFEASDPTG